jgi:uncharacterized surface anchored protein
MFLPLALAEQTEQTTVECGLVPGANLPPVTGSDIPLRQVTYTETIVLPKFDPGLGLLTKVHLTVDACGRQDFSIDNEDPGEGPFTFDLTHTGLIRVTVPLTIPEIVDVVVTETTTVLLPTDSDGIPDFVGDDSYSSTIENCSDAPLDKEYTLPSDLAVFTASSAGSTEFVNLPVRASGNMEIITDSGNAASIFATFMGAKACVVYEYQTFCINGSKINDCTELGLAGWTINLEDASGAVIATTTTDATGKYSFCDLLPGTYTVCETVMDGWTPVGETCRQVTIVDADVEGVNFVNTPLLCIEGSKTNACNGEGLPGWTINLENAAGTVIATTTTGADGSYQFCDLVSGSYTVCEVMQAGWTNIGDTCIPVTLGCVNVVGVNFENRPLLCIEGSKTNGLTGAGIPGWEICLTKPDGSEVCKVTDANGDYSFCELEPGVYEVCEEIRDGWTPAGPTCVTVTLDCENVVVDFENEEEIDLCINGSKTNFCTGAGIPGWEICLTNSAGNTVCTTTDANGDYSFCDLDPGTYTVCETPQAGWKPVEPTCTTVTLTNANVDDVNFENEPPFCISGHKFNDTTDEGLGGWTIQLKDASGAVIDTTTTADETGYYEFCGLFSGTYTVCEVMKPDWTAVGDICKQVTLDCGPSEDNDFRNKFFIPPPHYRTCPWYLKGESYRAQCGVTLEVDASHGVLYNDRIGASVINPELITIDPKYGTLTVEADGSFVYDPAPNLPRGTTTVTFKYAATTNDGYCDSTGEATAKISVTCR